MSSYVIEQQHDKNCFSAWVEGYEATLRYRLEPDTPTIILRSTYVPPAIEGRGIGSALVKAALEHAKAQGYSVKSLCWFVSDYIKLNPEYSHLLNTPEETTKT